MAVLNNAAALYIDGVMATAAYLDGVKVWPAFAPQSVAGCVLGLAAMDVAPGAVTTWPDRSPAANHVIPFVGAPVSTGQYVTATTAKTLGTTKNLGIVGNAPFHLLMAIRTRSVGGAFMGWGDAAADQLMDLWNYNPGTLIWHGHTTPGNDTVPGAPTFTPGVWHIADVFYDGAGRLEVGVDDQTPAAATGRVLKMAASQMLIGQGRYAAAGDFDLAGLFVYNRVLAAAERSAIRNYLKASMSTPDTIPGLALWVEADDVQQGAGPITVAVPAKVGPALTPSASMRLATNSTGGRKAFDFNVNAYGEQSLRTSANITLGTDVTVLVVVDAISPQPSQYADLMDFDHSGGGWVMQQDVNGPGNYFAWMVSGGFSLSNTGGYPGGPHIVELHKTGGVARVTIGSSVYSTTGSPGLDKPTGPLIIGNFAGGGRTFTGKISAVAAWPRALTPAELTTARSYFQQRWKL